MMELICLCDKQSITFLSALDIIILCFILCIFCVFRYYEFEVLLPGPMKVGWTKISMEPGQELGSDGKAFMFDGHMVNLYICYSDRRLLYSILNSYMHMKQLG